MSIRLLAVSRRFGKQRALDQVSLHVRPGDCYGFIGHNGAGKTTAMRIALGLDRAFSGQVLIDDFDMRRHARESRARLGGLVEVPGFHGHLDGAANLAMLARLQGFSRREAQREAARVLDLVGLGSVGTKPERAYSHGMRQRLGIAQALLGKPRTVVLDEPTNGLDPEGIAEMRELLRRLTRDEGVTVMLSSHQLSALSGLCNRIGVMHRGRLLIEQETSVLLGSAQGRYRLEAERETELLEKLKLPGRVLPGGGLVLELGSRSAPEVLRGAVASGFDVASFAPDPPTLEEIYLRYSKGADVAAVAGPGDSQTIEAIAAPRVRRAPPRPLLRVMRYELERAWSRGRLALFIVLPSVLAALRVKSAHSDWVEQKALVESGELFSATDVTAFEGVGLALRAGLPLAGILLAGLASQSLASELSRGTLRNLVLRPVKRRQAAGGKLLAQLSIAAGTYLLLAGVSAASAAWAFDFQGVSEVLPNGERFDLVPAAELWPLLRQAFLQPILPLAAFVSIGFCAGAVARAPAGALALALGSIAALDIGRAVAREFDLEALSPAAYMPSPLGDTSFLSHYADLAQGVSNSIFAYADTAQTVPLSWCAVTFSLALSIFMRRTIP
jgi:ABC-2 type transport system ATP-binding protein